MSSYGEFLQVKEQINIGAESMTGTLIKNPGGL